MRRELYGAGWEQFSHEVRFVRAGGRCECRGECGAPTCQVEREELGAGRCPREHGQAIGSYSDQLSLRPVVLTTAHLCADKACRQHVLALCQRCHLYLDRHHHARNASITRDAKRGQTRLDMGAR